MSSTETKKDSSKKPAKKNRAAEVANTFEWLITALILAFLFRAFVMEAFRIPTGSMADTLKGAHFRLRCTQCGYKYDYGFVPEKYGYPQDYVPRANLRSFPSRCPSCGHYYPTGGTTPIANGDRILVLKCIYQFFKPGQWDVVVFKNPLDPTINYIKRLIGRPGETVEIIDGDVYINGQISRKPPKVQNELWMPVYDNDYRPARPLEPSFTNNRPWRQPFNLSNSLWKTIPSDPTRFSLNCPPDRVNTMTYDTSVGNDLRATYAYDDVQDYPNMPYCSDLMVRLCVCSAELAGRVGINLSKYQYDYSAWVDFEGSMVIARTSNNGPPEELARTQIEPLTPDKCVLVKFANVDHQLIFEFGSQKLFYDLGRKPDDAGTVNHDLPPKVGIFGSGTLTLSHVALFRDIHYTSLKFAGSAEKGRAAEGNPFTLEEDEFFVLGDNSPNSEDSRWWSRPGKGNNGISYREGIIPRDYLVGKAMFVYWPSGFRPHAQFPLAVIPNVGAMRFIYGGSGRHQQTD